MNSSGIIGTENFVMQDTTQLIKNTGLRRVAGAITDFAALGERAVYGHARFNRNLYARATQKRNQE